MLAHRRLAKASAVRVSPQLTTFHRQHLAEKRVNSSLHRYALSQIARLVGIKAPFYAHFIGKILQRYDGHRGHERFGQGGQQALEIGAAIL